MTRIALTATITFGAGKGNKPPNNWSGFFGGGTWQYDELSGEYYLHLFAKNQPDLNYRNPKVLEEVKDIMRFWLDKGIAGFRCDVINILYKSSLEDGKRSLILTGSEHYLSQEGTHEILRTLRREVLSHYDCFTVGETVFVTPKSALDLMAPERKELDMVFSFEHMETDQYIVKWFKRRFHAGRFAKSISKWQNALPWNATTLKIMINLVLYLVSGRWDLLGEVCQAPLHYALDARNPFIYQARRSDDQL